MLILSSHGCRKPWWNSKNIYLFCRNPSFGLVTKAKGLQGCEPRKSPGVKAKRSQGCGPRRSSGVTSHTPELVRKCEGI